ncbi:S-adenosyl-L-methionine-dependent methyltransferase [Patellaria atrata CBS 101060]|uniref:S-adenosyl-L-methionine-dependent methyltransferase n=1 Tax=Patellaria atrata CBS 101060 TaxID=1346257 RepID=A0A9P4VL91_9PEZI|nr:S-adenosyl-L-methionine-dependent methyltransferase [Patellaria atrata CBS 101060]
MEDSEPNHSQQPIEADDNVSLTSDYESVLSETQSASSSIFNYTYENGHTYHAYRAGQYLLPNDESEQDRLDLQHHIFMLCLGGELCVTNLEHAQDIMDAGTGTGIWAIDVADKYPQATVTGVDLSPIQPSWVPSNIKFEIDDLAQDWTWPEDRFDFIHVRTLGGAISHWSHFLSQAYKHLKPGGKIEVSEIRTHFHCDDGSFPEDSYSRQWENTFHDIAAKIGLNFDQIPYMAKWLEAAGYTDVQETEKIVPIGPWPKNKQLKEIGRYYQVHLLEGGMENYTMALFTRNGWEPAEVQVLLAKVREEVRSNKMHSYTKAVFVTGQKPKFT